MAFIYEILLAPRNLGLREDHLLAGSALRREGFQNHNCLWNKVNDSPQLLFVRKEFGLSELYVTSTGGGRQFLTCGTTGRCGIPLTMLLLHVNLSTVWRHLLAFVAL
jgi:hypothetical protein